MPKIEFTATHLIVDRKRVRVSYTGPNCWVDGVDPTTMAALGIGSMLP